MFDERNGGDGGDSSPPTPAPEGDDGLGDTRVTKDDPPSEDPTNE